MRKESSNELDAEIFRHFDELDTESEPEFQQVWQRALSQADSSPRDQRRNWVPLAVAATVMLVVVLVNVSSSIEERSSVLVAETDRDAVFKELIATTRWRAPSDELLKGRAALQVWNVPQFEWLNNFDSEES